MAHQPPKGRHPGGRRCLVVMQGLPQIGVVRLHPRQQAAAFHFHLEKFEHVQGGGIAYHILGKALPQQVAARFRVGRQGGRNHMQAGAPGIRVGGLQHMGHGLNLANPPRRIGQPGGVVEFGRTLGILLTAFQLGLLAPGDKGGNGRAEGCSALR